MADKPQPKRKIGIRGYNQEIRFISIETDPETAKLLEEFGLLTKLEIGGYHLIVDTRYNFQEVLDYILSIE